MISDESLKNILKETQPNRDLDGLYKQFQEIAQELLIAKQMLKSISNTPITEYMFIQWLEQAVPEKPELVGRISTALYASLQKNIHMEREYSSNVEVALYSTFQRKTKKNRLLIIEKIKSMITLGRTCLNPDVWKKIHTSLLEKDTVDE